MNPEQVFLLVQPEILTTLAVAGFVLGYVFTARLSLHLSWRMMLLRLIITGGSFILTMMFVRMVTGSELWEVWLGILIGWLVYAVAMSWGIWCYDWRFKRAVEKALGRSIRGSPRTVLSKIPDRRTPK